MILKLKVVLDTGRKVKGTIHWVDANNCVPADFRLYEPLILDDAPENEGKHFLEQINPNSLEILQGFIEPTAVELSLIHI